jgi:cellulose synthase/poly-beta-1,6-N-acetylglucosamine synthase-like glycosyltransferase/peptidoglycan/xylan/chitin deacetylase (PgdA/CDA1 family)
LLRRRPASPSHDAAEAALRRRLWSPPGHWTLLALVLFVVAVVVTFQGVMTHTIGPSSEPVPPSGAPATLEPGRAIFGARDDRLVPIGAAPGRRVALTFDDGPDPKWTTKIADVLERHRVPATFFIVGSQAARHPDIVRRLAADGHEIGNHTFTHSGLTQGAEWQRRVQLDLTEAVIVGITGRYARLVRSPYSGTVDVIAGREERALARLAGRRYYIVLADIDSEDWRRRGAARIADEATPKGSSGGVVMFHDGGGDRRQTIAALETLIPRLRERGFRFVSVADMAGVRADVVQPRAPASERHRGNLFAWSVRFAFFLGTALGIAILAIGVLVMLRVILVLTLAAHHARSVRLRGDRPEYLPDVSIVVPAYNEEVGIGRAVASLAASDYPGLEIVVVDDGSTDRTAAIVQELGLPGVVLVRQDNAGKAAALNTGIGVSRGDVIVMVDGDTVFERDTVRRLVQPLADPAIAAVSGNTKVGNRSGLLGRWQHIEYVMGFNLDRRLYEVLQCTPTVPGAIGAFQRSVLDEVGGVSGDTLAEDTDLTLAIGRAGHKVVYAEDARAWTEAPSTVGGLWRQRYRWSFGTMQAVWKHRGAVLSRSPGERRVGRRALPYMLFFQIALPIFSPLIDLYALYGIFFADAWKIIAAWGGFLGLGLVIAAYGFWLDREPMRPLWAFPLQQFVYRQLVYLVVVESTVSALVGARAHWRSIPRTGDVRVGA